MKTKVKNTIMRTAMTLLLALLAFTGAQATDFIKEVMVIGGNSDEVDPLKTSLTAEGWTLINRDLNAGCGSSSDYIYLLYKSESNPEDTNLGYITDFYISNSTGTAPATLSHNGRTYYLVSFDGGDHFKQLKGDLNSNAGGDDIHLYCTWDAFPDRRAVTGISFNDTQSGALGVNGTGSGYDLNSGCGAGTDYIYMHVATEWTIESFSGTGTDADPFLISSLDDWSHLVNNVANDLGGGKCYRLTTDLSVATMVGGSGHPFSGTFDGNGKTLTVNFVSSETGTALFRSVTNATIKNLTVSGNVYAASANHASGLIGGCGGTVVISGCTVACNVRGANYAGGMVGHGGSSTLTIVNSCYSGTLGGFQNYAGGLVGWCDAMTLTVNNCLFSGTFEPYSGGKYHPVVCKNGGSNVSAIVLKTFYLKDYAPTAGGNNIVPSADGTPVSTTVTNYGDIYNVAVKAADGATYYAPPTYVHVIKEAPESPAKGYIRSGNSYYSTSVNANTEVTIKEQGGLLEVVYASNNDVYLRDPVFPLILNSYVKGKLRGDKIVVPLPQYIHAYSENGTGYKLELTWVDVDDSGSLTVGCGTPDHVTTEAVYTINDNTITLEGSSKNHVLGASVDITNGWAGRGDYESTYTSSSKYVTITPPAGSSPVDYELCCQNYQEDGSHFFHRTLKVVKDGNDVYIQGLANGVNDAVVLPKAWAKGTLSGNKLTIPIWQYMGTLSCRPIVLWGVTGTTLTDITFTYNSADDTFILDNNFLVSYETNPYTYFFSTYELMFSSTIFKTVPTPGGEQYDWMISGIYEDKDEDETIRDIKKRTNVAINGNNIYIQGLSDYFPKAWIKGTISGNTATFPGGQFMGFEDTWADFLTGSDGTEMKDIVFNYDSENMKLTLSTPRLVENDGKYALNEKGSYWSLSVYKIPRVQVPEGLETTQYKWTGWKVSREMQNGELEYVYNEYKNTLNIGFDGSDVYVQGFSSENFPDAWIKGTRNGNTVTFPKGQFLGLDDKHYLFTGALYLHYFMGFNNNNPCDMVFNYNSTTNTFFSDTWMAENYNDNNYSPVAAYAGNVWSISGKELVAVPPGVNIEDGWRIEGTFISGSNSYSVNKLDKVAFNGNNVYIKGISYNCPDAWIKGIINGNTAMFSSGQYMGKKGSGDVFMTGYDGSEIVTITFTYDSEAKTFTLITPYLAENKSQDTYDPWGYYDQLSVSQLVTLPQGLIAEDNWIIEGVFHSNSNAITVSGKTQVAFDGDDVYVKGISYNFPDAWLKGTVSGNTATFASGQFVGENSSGDVFMTGFDGSEMCDIVFTYSSSRETRTFTLATPYLVENKSFSTLNAQGYYQQLTIYTNTPPLVTVPKNIEIESDWTIEGYLDYDFVFHSTDVAFDGDDIYIKGISYHCPDAWLKGTINGSTATFASGQYMGQNGSDNVYMVGFNNSWDTVVDIVFNYDSQAGKFTLSTPLLADNKTPDTYDIIEQYSDLSIYKGKPIPDLVELPEGVVAQDDWTLEGLNVCGNNPLYICKSTEVAFDGNDIYIKGIPLFFSDSWIKGTVNGNTATFASGQYVGIKSTCKGFMVGYDGSGFTDIVFTYDSEAKSLTLTTPYLIESTEPDTTDDLSYFLSLSVFKGEPNVPEQVTVPEGLETEQYYWSANAGEYKPNFDTGEIDIVYTEYIKKVNIGFDGNNVYVQGLCEDLPQAWVKGTLSGNTVTFATGQYFGNDESDTDNIYKHPHYLVGKSDINGTICDVVFSFDATARRFTNDTWLVDCWLPDKVQRFTCHNIYTNNKWLPITTEPAIPANPSFKSFLLYYNYYWIVSLYIPRFDVAGNIIDSDKLFYRLYSDIEGDIQQLVFSPDEYIRLSETLYEIPYAYNDHWDINVGGSIVYLNQSNVEDFNRIGVQSVYYGGDVCNTSDIVWYEIKDYSTPTGIAENSNEGVKSVRYYNAAGMPCDRPTTNGLYIVVKEMEDGTVKVEKRNH